MVKFWYLAFEEEVRQYSAAIKQGQAVIEKKNKKTIGEKELLGNNTMIALRNSLCLKNLETAILKNLLKVNKISNQKD